MKYQHKLEDIPEEEYKQYLDRLSKKDINKMDYTELSDLACFEIEDACDKQDWKKLKLGFRLIWLVTNKINAKADVTKELLIRFIRGDKDEI